MSGLSTAEFDRLVATGEIPEGSRLYLWDGEVCELMTENEAHVTVCEWLFNLLRARLPVKEWTIFTGRPFALSDGYKPQPDYSVVRGYFKSLALRPRTVENTALAIEVADSSVRKDTVKFLKRYGLDGVVQYWVVNITARRVEVYTQPDRVKGSYRKSAFFEIGTEVPLVLTLEGKTTAYEGIPVDDIFGGLPRIDPAAKRIRSRKKGTNGSGGT
jgi:Uma2 family endonuclease